MEHISENKKPITFTEWMRNRFHGILELAGGFLNRIGLMPNTMTVLGLVGNAVGAILVAQGWMTIGGLVIFVMGFVDALDGTMARLRGMASSFGAFVDSVTDRYSELAIFGGLLYYYAVRGEILPVVLVYVSAAGSVLVSYVRSRGESLGWETKIGLLTRMERYMVLAPSLVFNNPIIGLWIIAIFANITAIQRIVDIRRQAIQKQENNAREN